MAAMDNYLVFILDIGTTETHPLLMDSHSFFNPLACDLSTITVTGSTGWMTPNHGDFLISLYQQ